MGHTVAEDSREAVALEEVSSPDPSRARQDLALVLRRNWTLHRLWHHPPWPRALKAIAHSSDEALKATGLCQLRVCCLCTRKCSHQSMEGATRRRASEFKVEARGKMLCMAPCGLWFQSGVDTLKVRKPRCTASQGPGRPTNPKGATNSVAIWMPAGGCGRGGLGWTAAASSVPLWP